MSFAWKAGAGDGEGGVVDTPLRFGWRIQLVSVPGDVYDQRCEVALDRWPSRPFVMR